jgi:predicted MFS family arabinose efflux permease
MVLKAEPQVPTPNNFRDHLFLPWKDSWQLLRQRRDFTKYQIGFMLVGSGLMVIQPALPIYFVDTLHLSYTELAVALTLCKGIGFALGSPVWSRWINSVDIFRFSSTVASLAVLFPIALILTQYQMSWLYISYFVYGFMQSGNELSWNMSGPIFAKESNSTLYTNVNTMAIGVRGAFVPALGGLCISLWGASSVMVLSSVLCLAATVRLYNHQPVQRADAL